MGTRISFTATFVAALPIESGQSATTGKAWMRQTFIFQQTDGQYPTSLAVSTFSNTMAASFAAIRPGTTCEVTAWVESRESRTKPGMWFTELRGASVTPVTQQPAPQTVYQQPQQYQPQPAPQQVYQQPAQPQYQPQPAQAPMEFNPNDLPF